MKKVFGILTILMLLFTGCGNNSDSVKKLKLAHALTEGHPVHLAMVEFAKEVKDKTDGKVEILIFCGNNSDSVKKLKLAHALTEGHPVHLAMVEFAKEVKDKTDGKVEILIFPNGQLGGEREITELMQAGAIDMIKTNAGPMESFAKEYSVLSLPYLFKDIHQNLAVLKSDIGEDILNATIDRGFIGLTFYNSGTRNMYTKKPVKSVTDLNGMKIRVQTSKTMVNATIDRGFIGLTFYNSGTRNMYTKKPVKSVTDLNGMKIRVQTSKTMVKMTELLGGSPSPLSFGEIYTALQQGVVDGAENNLISYAESKHYEVAPYFTFDAHSISPDVMIMNTKAWNKLSEDEQKIIKQAALNSFDYQNKIWFETEDKLVDSLKAQGVQFFEVDQNEFVEKVQPLYNDVMKDPLIKTYVDETEDKLVDSLKAQGVQFFEVDQNEFVEKVQPLYNDVMKDPLIKTYVERIREFKY